MPRQIVFSVPVFCIVVFTFIAPQNSGVSSVAIPRNSTLSVSVDRSTKPPLNKSTNSDSLAQTNAAIGAAGRTAKSSGKVANSSVTYLSDPNDDIILKTQSRNSKTPDGKNNKTDGDSDDSGNEDEDGSGFDVDEEDPLFTVETMVTIVVTLVVLVTNATTIIVAASTEAFSNFNKIFLYSMSLADLLIGLFALPYSIVLSLFGRWVFDGNSLCNVQAYVILTLHGAKLFSMTWLNVDHYIAVRKPERYNVMMSQTRSLCWIGISWLAAVCFFMPPMLNFKRSFFNQAIFVCQADTKGQIAYILTSVALVSMPVLLALLVTNVYLFTKSYRTRIKFYEKVFVELSTRPLNYHTTFVMCAVMVLLWVPFCVLGLVEELGSVSVEPRIEFYFCWLGFCCSFSNFFVLLAKSAPFRQAVSEMYAVCDWCPAWCPARCCSGSRSRSPNRHRYSSDVNVITIARKN